MRIRLAFLAAGIALAAAACAPNGGSVAAPSAPSVSEAPVQPPPAATVPPAPSPSAPDASCRVAGDCAVKNVGNCCGYFPACVNKDAVVDPDAVRAECERSGMASVCGWRDIQACDCVQNQCRAVDGPIPVDR